MDHHDLDIAGLTRANEDFRRVVATGEHSQIVVMAVPAGGEIGDEVHPDVDQVLYFVEGEGEAILDGETSAVAPGRLAFVPAGTRHNFKASAAGPLKLYTVYAPPEHPDGTVHHTKEEADAAEHH
jgi:mannose-6-phosphate isomerase-like protein (cupin superfamily)